MAILATLGLAVPSTGIASLTTTTAKADVLDIPQALIGVLASNLGLLSVDVLPTTEAMGAVPEGESLDVYRLSASNIVLNGLKYVVSLDPTTLPTDYIDADGIATFQMSATNLLNGNLLTTFVSARAIRLDAGSAPVWTDAVGSSGDVSSQSASEGGDDGGVPEYSAKVASSDESSAARLARIPIATSVKRKDVKPTRVGPMGELDGTGSGPVPKSKQSKVAGATTAAETTTGNCTVGPGPRITKVAGSSSLRYATIGTTYPVGSSTGGMTVSSSKGAEYGIAASVSGSYGTWSVSGSSFAQSGWSKEWLGITSSRSYQKQVQYYKWKYEYLDSRCNHYHQIPYTETGGTASNTGIDRPSWTTWCTHEDPGPWWRDNSDGSAYAYSAAVKFSSALGIDLSIKRNYSTSSKVGYNIVGTTRQLCGNNTWPSNASKLMER